MRTEKQRKKDEKEQTKDIKSEEKLLTTFSFRDSKQRKLFEHALIDSSETRNDVIQNLIDLYATGKVK